VTLYRVHMDEAATPGTGSTARPIPEHILDGYRKTLNAFVVRARRVEAHSLLADVEQFVVWVHGSARLEITPEKGEMLFDVPPEEAFESLAARVRPLLLEQDGLHHARVLAAIGAFSRGDDEVTRAREVLQRAWDRATGAEALGFLVGEARDGAELIADVTLAHGWLYGDLVHAKPNVPEAVMQTSLNQRYIASVLIYGQAAMAAVGTLNVVRRAAKKGLVELSDAAVNSPVTVPTPLTMPLVAARIGPRDQLSGYGSGPPTAP